MATSDELLNLIARTNQPNNPADRINLAVPTVDAAVAANPALSPSVLGAIQQSGPVQPGNIVVAPLGPEANIATRWGSSTEGGDPTFAETNANAPIYGGGGIRANAALAGVAQRDRALVESAKHQQFQEQLGLANLAMAQRAAESEAASRHLDVISKTQALTDKAKADADTSAFIIGLNQIPHDAPDYEARVGALYSAHSRVTPSAVAGTLELKNTARTRDFEGRKLGGADAYSGPAKDAFDNNFAETHDIYAAHAAAKSTQENEKMLHQALKEGTLTPSDFTTPGQGALGANGHVNYEQVKAIADSRQGEATGKPVTAAEKNIQQSRNFIEAYSKNPAALEGDPRLKELYDIHVAKVLDYEKSKNPGAVTPQPVATTFTQF
jgi:hypothetical protein